jgi:cytochrome c oxidase subunit VIc
MSASAVAKAATNAVKLKRPVLRLYARRDNQNYLMVCVALSFGAAFALKHFYCVPKKETYYKFWANWDDVKEHERLVKLGYWETYNDME